MTLGNTPAGDDMSSLAQGTAGGGAGGSITAGGGGDVNGRFFVVPSSNNSNNNNIIRPNQTQPQPQTQPPMAAMTGISHTQIDDEFDQELGGNIGKPKKSGLWASLGARGPSRTVTGATSFDNAAGNSVQPTVITSRGALQPDAVAAATAATGTGSGRPPAVSSRDLPLPDDTYDDTFKQLVTKNRSSRRLRPYRKRWRRVIIISVLSLCFIAFALTIGIYFGIKQREAQVRGNSGATTQSAPTSNMCCSRDQVTCAEDLRNLCSTEQTCTTTCEAFWITPSSSDGGSPSSPSTTAGCCSLDGGRTCEGGGGGGNNNYYGGGTNNNEEEGVVNNSNYYGGTINNNEEEGGVSSSNSYYYGGTTTNNYNNATLSQLCNSNQQSCETNGECLGGAWIPYCCSTDGQYCDFTDTQPQCDVDSNTCLSTTCGGIAYGPYQSILKKGGCCSYDGGVTCGTVRDGKAQQCDMVAEDCHSLCRGVYKSTKEDGCCSRDFGITCDSSLKITTKNNNNRLPDFCDESQASCELTCGGTFKLPIPEFVTQQSNTTTTPPPTPAPIPAPSPPPAPTAVDLTQQIKSLLVDSGVSLSNEQALERDNVTGLALTPQSRALQWLSTADSYTKGLINLLPDNSGGSSALLLSDAPMEVNQTLVQRFGLALLFFSTTNLPKQSWSSAQGWLSPTNHCTWYGVTCGDSAGNSTTTSSVGRQASLAAFQPVTELSLGGNNLSSQDALEHPELFRSLGDTLVTLDLRDNSIGGRFGGSTEHEGALESLKQLQTLSLFNNSIEGTISTYLGSLSSLEKIYMENNQMEGSLPTQIGNLMNLKRMDLYSNKMVGPIPKEIGMLTNLERLWLSNNMFDSTLPQELSNCQSLQALYLDQNKFVGSIPSNLFTNLINLEDVRMYQNQFNGTIPPFSGQLTKLQLFYLDNNLLSGPLPRDYPASLKELSLYNNSLEGSIPSTLGRQPTNLQVLALSMNKLNSTIPTEFSFLENLNVLHLYNNSLQGELPQQFPSNIRDLFLQHNSLQGTIPQYIYNYTKVNLSNNNFSGNLPTPVGTNLRLQSLSVSRNPRLGNNGAPIPSEVCSTTQLPNLQTVTVSCTNSIAGFNGGGAGGGFTITQLQPCVTCT